MAFLSQATSSWRLASPSRLPFRSMLLTPRGGPWCLAPRAHQIPVYLMVFSTFLCRAFTAHRAVMVRHPLTIIAINPPDSDRGAHDILRYIARHALRLRRHLALLHVGHQAVRILRETGIDSAVDRAGLECPAEHRQQMPLPLAPQKRIGQVLEMFPALFLVIIPSTGGEQMQMGMVLPIAPMGVEHCDGATPERFAPDRAIEII